MEDVVAIITLDSQNLTVVDLTLTQKKYHFTCKQCASLCCKLGGPVITKNEAKLIESSGFCVADFLEPINRDVACSSVVAGSLKTRSNGSCIFLKRDQAHNRHYCSIYPVRPALCRLYPFSFEHCGPNKVALKIIPCCLGLSSCEGELVTEKFVSDRVLEPLLEAMRLLQSRRSI